VEQLHAAADILAREWDPLGARLGDLSRDDLTEHVSAALQIALGGQSRELIERQISRYLASVEQDAFGLRPSPAEQRRYLARRLMRVIVDMPGSLHEGTLFDDVRSEVTPNGGGSMKDAVGRIESKLRDHDALLRQLPPAP
jgi:hypothetical protein